MIQSPSYEPCSEQVLDLFQGDKLIELFRKNVQKFHVGDWNVAELELLSVASQSVVNTDGIQPKLSGKAAKARHTSPGLCCICWIRACIGRHRSAQSAVL